MNVVLFHPDERLCAELTHMCEKAQGVTVLPASYEELFESGLCRDGVLVTPGNGFGLMDGGFDGVVERLHPGTQQIVQRMIARRYGLELPVGAALLLFTQDGQRLCYAPTMQMPMQIAGTDHVYRAARAAAELTQESRMETMYMPLMGCGAGGMHPRNAVDQMLCGVQDGTARIEPEELTWAHADRMHMRWHRLCGVPDDGFRFAERYGRVTDGELDHRADG